MGWRCAASCIFRLAPSSAAYGEASAGMLIFTPHVNLHPKKVCATLSTTSGS